MPPEAEVSDAAQPGAPTAGPWQQTTHGKGRVRPRKNAPPGNNVPRLAAVAHSDAEHGVRVGCPPPRYREQQADGWVEYLKLDSPQNVYAALAKLREHQPVLLQGAPLAGGLVGRWTFPHLAEAIGGERPLRVLCSDAKRDRFIECDAAKNVYGGLYHVREPETQVLQLAFPEFVKCSTAWRARRLYMRETVMRYQPPQQAQQEASAGAPTPSADASSAADGSSSGNNGSKVPSYRPRVQGSSPAAAGLRQDLESGLNWEWLESLQRSQRYGPVLQVDLEACCTGGLLPAAYECADRLLAQVAGSRRVLLLPPGQAFEGLYPYPMHHPYDRYSMVDFEAPDAGLWPKFGGGARGVAAVLHPGDVLYVPAYWFAHVQHLEPECLSLSLHLAQGARPPAAGASPLRVSRALEQRVADVEGPADVRHWLQLIGHGEEHEWIDLGTVKGYRRIVFCQSVRDDVAGALGQGAWSTLLPRMCEGRLVPTPWLNKDFREPLYLTDKPVVYQDTRTEEERRYPQLFRAKLEAEGWHVPATVSTVPIPGVNMPKNADYRTWQG